MAAKFVAPDLVKYLKGKNSRAHSSAELALGNLSNIYEPVVQAILALVEDENLGVGRFALQVLDTALYFVMRYAHASNIFALHNFYYLFCTSCVQNML